MVARGHLVCHFFMQDGTISMAFNFISQILQETMVDGKPPVLEITVLLQSQC